MVSKWAGLLWWVRGRLLKQHFIFLWPQIFCWTLWAKFRNADRPDVLIKLKHTCAAYQNTPQSFPLHIVLVSWSCLQWSQQAKFPPQLLSRLAAPALRMLVMRPVQISTSYIMSTSNEIITQKQNIHKLIEIIEHQMRYKNFISSFVYSCLPVYKHMFAHAVYW